MKNSNIKYRICWDPNVNELSFLNFYAYRVDHYTSLSWSHKLGVTWNKYKFCTKFVVLIFASVLKEFTRTEIHKLKMGWNSGRNYLLDIFNFDLAD